MNELEHLIRQGLPPAPPPGLKDAVLAAAATGRREPGPPWWWRPAVRWAWVGVTAALIAANVLVGTRPAVRAVRNAQRRPVMRLERAAVDDPVLARALALASAEPTQARPAAPPLDLQRLIGGPS